jgi:hypothetical protein
MSLKNGARRGWNSRLPGSQGNHVHGELPVMRRSSSEALRDSAYFGQASWHTLVIHQAQLL